MHTPHSLTHPHSLYPTNYTSLTFIQTHSQSSFKAHSSHIHTLTLISLPNNITVTLKDTRSLIHTPRTIAHTHTQYLHLHSSGSVTVKYQKPSGCGKLEQCDQYKLPDNKVLISFTRPHSAAGQTGDIVKLSPKSTLYCRVDTVVMGSRCNGQLM